jgi:(S)-2-hydroxyglutarate dehydrogenase
LGLSRFDAVVVGGGIVGLATALALVRARPRISIAVLEKETEIAAHQTGRNSGVIHSGLYYKPGSLKARTCARGRALLERFCEEHGVRFERCGKLVVATRNEDLPRLDELERRGRANGLTSVRRIGKDEIGEHEPHATGLSALHVAETGIVDYRQVAQACRAELARSGVALRTGAKALAAARHGQSVIVTSTSGDFEGRVLVACAGLESDRFARSAGIEPDVVVLPFRGEYWNVSPERTHLVRNLIYPVPDPAYPFLGVHFTRRIGGGIEVGPNAVLAMAREGYSRTSFDVRDVWTMATWPGAWRMAARHWRAALREQWRSLSRSAFARAGAALVPEVRAGDLVPGGAGVRAQAVARDGSLVDDFVIAKSERMVHVLNAPSPAATASLAIGEEIASHALSWV